MKDRSGKHSAESEAGGEMPASLKMSELKIVRDAIRAAAKRRGIVSDTSKWRKQEKS